MSASFGLQPGWEERVHTDGRVFYINHSKSEMLGLLGIEDHNPRE